MDSSPMDVVTSPLRLLILEPAPPQTGPAQTSSAITLFLTGITGSVPSPEQISAGFAGYTTHTPLQLRTKYYHASVGIWCDQVDGEWKQNMADTAEEAREVRNAVGGVVFVLGAEDIRRKADVAKALDLLEQVEEFRVMCEDGSGGREIVGLVVLVGDSAEEKIDEVEEGLRGQRGVFGWDVIGWHGDAESVVALKEKNRYGEKTGIARVVEILEAVPWTTSSVGDVEAGLSADEGESDWTISEQRELDREIMGVKVGLRQKEENIEPGHNASGEDEWSELQDGGEDFKVEQLQGLMERLIATREAASELSGPEKQKFAKREVERIMREVG